MAEIRYSIETVNDQGVVSAIIGSVEITPEDVGELGTTAKFTIDVDLQIAQGGPVIRPKNPR